MRIQAAVVGLEKINAPNPKDKPVVICALEAPGQPTRIVLRLSEHEAAPYKMGRRVTITVTPFKER